MEINNKVEVSKCPICRFNAYEYFRHKDVADKELKLFKCINCGHGHYGHKYSKNELNSIYEAEYASGYIEDSELSKLRRIQYKEDVKILKKYIDNDKEISVLDYGCSNGGFLKAMPKFWRKYGFEINPTHKNYVKMMHPEIKLVDDIGDINKSLDLIVMRGVIEHIQVFDKVIDNLCKKIKKGGGLFITATPNFESICSILYKEQWSQIKAPEHIHHFTIASLGILLMKHRLVLKNYDFQYFKTPYENWRRDKKIFLENNNKHNKVTHAFPGNMITAYFEKN